ncbi:MAG: hypothetical protein FJ088_07310, partial [Deltaproteobacteria bacterium]|nr:hypothetical protein [Deltaproteobacteria bacterium]
MLKRGFGLIREGDSYFKEGEPSAAYQRYMEALKIFPTWFLPNLRLGIVSKHLGLSGDTILGYFKRALEFEPENGDALYHLGIYHMEKGDPAGGEG